ncbi:anaerobic ribonucleoside-triphosphate reductase [Methanocaldococcus vulcanius M7]|uniref:Anaerobic ribonucleoside-triphosphate reductase n=1 Tax=Methanocaldococcus vulcanius (strain ATCC 700851 / DSM 12094 / M7) TaxID=579137 RepID=C9REJ7_METVM|nr:anaerobic ribonucleoside-triphosphate reductase [Methanocaldococcus vulcanius]ACX71999.1 anaerobic ribonucleoside-triphosphate reductase [Methanocaldococcus vulcanius M7]
MISVKNFSEEKLKLQIIKRDGREEKFNINKLVKSLINSGVNYGDLENILSEIYTKVYNGMSTEELKNIVYDILKRTDPKIAENYKNKVILKVRTSEKEFEPFDKEKIVKALVKEAGADKKIAQKIADEVELELKKLNVKYLTAPMIREIVNAKLLEYGFEELRHKHTRLGMPIYDITKLLKMGSRENANLMYNPESIHKWVADETMKQYALLAIFPKHIADAHIKGDIHLHDLEYAATRPVCLQHDLRPFFMHGLKVDGTGLHTCVSKPAKHPEVAIQHAAKVMMAAQTNMSGGQSIDEFNVWLAPYVRGLSYERIKQLMQMFIYEMNQMYVSRGGQCVFSSINLELEIPEFLRDKPAVIAGTTRGTYGDYEEEAKLILEALVDVMMEGDAMGKPFIFPNFIIKLRDNAFSNENEELMVKIHELSAKFGIPYFINMLPDWQVVNTNSMGCRTRLSGNWTGDAEIDTLRTGNMQWYSLNLPRIAYEASGDDDRLFEILHERLELVKEALLIKHEVTLERLYVDKMLSFLTQEFDDGQYYRYENTTKTFGFVGLNEMLKFHLGEELHDSKEAVKFGEKVIGYMRDYADRLKEETGLRWTVTQTPAESLAGRMAKLDYKYFRDQAKTVVRGDLNDVNTLYYTNSSHVRVDAPITLGEKVRIEEKFHPLCNGGHIMHVWNMEAAADPEVLMDITKKITRTNIGYWTYTKNLSVCNKCGLSVGGLRDKCVNCGSENVAKFSRITGYLQNVANWNKAKQKELIDRKMLRI